MLDAVRDRLTEPSARGLARAVSRAVGEGALPPGQRLPPIRSLARELRLSPTTVSAAWAILARAGTIQTDGRRGTVVAPRRPAGPARYRRALEHATPFEIDLSTGLPDPDLLPDLGPALRRLHAATTPETYLDEPVLPELLDHLQADWPYPAGMITIVDGAMDAHDLIVDVVLGFGDRVAVEDPCFPPLADRLDAAGADIVPIAVDASGPMPDAVAAAARDGVRAIFLQPRAQNPTGVSLTDARSAELAAILRPTEVLVVENDSAGAVASSPLISLGGRLPERTIHVRSFAKSHGPDLRLAAVGGPVELIEQLVERRRLGQGWTSRILQRILLDLLSHKTSIAQVDKARREYHRRRQALTSALAERGVEAGGTDGLNLWLPVADETTALVALAGRGIGAAPGGPFRLSSGSEPHLRVTCGLLRADQGAVADALADAARPGTWTARR